MTLSSVIGAKAVGGGVDAPPPICFIGVAADLAVLTEKGFSMYIVTTLKADGTREVANLNNKPSLDVLQREVGGLIQSVPHWINFEGRRADIFCNEEGRLNGMLLNKTATDMWKDTLGYSEMTRDKFRYTPELFGNVVIVQKALG